MRLQDQTIRPRSAGAIVKWLATALMSVVSLAVTLTVLPKLFFTAGVGGAALPEPAGLAIMDRFDGFIAQAGENALSGVEPIRWIYTLNDEDLIAPEPNPACYGTSGDPAELQWLLDAAEEKLQVGTTIFTTQTQIMPGSQITYYLDDSILSITWKEIRNWTIYTISEVKIADASQFRRYLSDGIYGSKGVYHPSEMAATVNAVAASGGDFYMMRSWGVNIYLGQAMNAKKIVDSCYITESGDLLFTRAGEIESLEAAQQFAEENHVRFSLAFGPVMVENGENVVPSHYPLGEIDGHYARAALCQAGELHYLLVAVNSEGGYVNMPTSDDFARELVALGVDKAYALDGGQSAAIITNDTLINRPVYGYQRRISDIIYFATAIPEERWQK